MVGIEALLNDQSIDSSRIEFKAGWKADSIHRSICAFANDVDNIGGGYIIVGMETDEKSRVGYTVFSLVAVFCPARIEFGGEIVVVRTIMKSTL